MSKTLETLSKIKELPTLPFVVLQLNRILRDETATIEEINSTIARDSSLTSKVLRLANSSYYGLSYHVDTLTKAIIILGSNTIRNLAVTISLSKLFDNPSASSFDIKGLWLHSLGCAVTSKAFVSKKKDPVSYEKAFIAAILHDIGKLVIYLNLPDKMDTVIETINKEANLNPSEIERNILGFTHSDVGAYVAEKWHFPRELTDAIKFHHNPETAKDNLELIYAVHAGNEIAKALAFGKSTCEKVRNINPSTWKILEITEDDLQTLLLEVKMNFYSIVDSLNLNSD